MFWKRFLRRFAGTRRPATRKRPTTRPGVECLERRVVPAISGLKLDGITGDGPNGEIAVDSYSFAESGATAGRPTLGDFHFTVKASRATPDLFRAEVSGQHFRTAVFTERAPGKDVPVEVLRYTLSDALITSFREMGGQGIDPQDEITLRFSRIEERVSPQPPGSPVITASWDTGAGRGSVSGGTVTPAPTDAPVGLQIDGVPGEFHNGSAVESYSFGETSASAGHPALGDVVVRLKTGAASPYLFLANDTGQRFGRATLTVLAPGPGGAPVEARRIALEGVRVTSFTTKDGEDEVALHFDVIHERVTTERPDGSLPAVATATWDTRTATGSVSGATINPQPTFAPVGLAIDGVPAEFRNGVAVDSYSFSETSTTAGHPELGDLVVRLKTGAASPYLFLANDTGQEFRSAALTVYRPGPGGGAAVEAQRIDLSHVRVTSYTTKDGEDEVSLHFDALRDRVTVEQTGGPPAVATATWDTRTATGSVSGATVKPAPADAPVGLAIDGVPGEFHNGSAVDSYSFGESSATAGHPSLGDVVVRLKTGAASPYLFLANDTGQRFAHATLTVLRPTPVGGAPVEARRITLEGVRVTSFTTKDGEDEVALHFDVIEERVDTQQPDGSRGPVITASWDTGTGTGSVSGGVIEPAPSYAPVGLQIDGVPREFFNGVAVDSYSFSESSPTAGHPALGDVVVRLKTGAASPYLFLANDTGQMFRRATLSVLRPGPAGGAPVEARRITLEGVRVTSFTTKDGEDEVALHFDRIQERVDTEQPGGGSGPVVSALWDARTGTGNVSGGTIAAAPSHAPVGLQIDGVPGEFLNGSAVDSYGFSPTSPSVSGDLVVRLKTGAASPYLFLANDTGQRFAHAALTVYRPGPGGTGEVVAQHVILSGVRVTSFTTADGEDEVTLHFDSSAVRFG